MTTFSEWWEKRWPFGFGTRWLEPLCIPMASAAWEEAGAIAAVPMAARVSSTCYSQPGGPYIVTAHFASRREAQAAHSWLAHLKTPNV